MLNLKQLSTIKDYLDAGQYEGLDDYLGGVYGKKGVSQKPSISNQYLDLLDKVFVKEVLEQPGIILILPLEWMDEVYPEMKEWRFGKRADEPNNFWNVITPYGILDGVLFTRVEKPIYYKRSLS